MKRSLNPNETNGQLSYEYDRGSNYEDELRLTTALSALIPEDDTRHPDHRFFQVVHLISEYAWVQIHYELRRVIEHLDADRPQRASRLLARAVGLSDITVQSVRMIGDHLPQHSLLMMRNALPDDATGLDSPGYRNLKRVARAVSKSFEAALDRAGLKLPDLIAAQDDTSGSPEDSQALASVREGLLRLDSGFLSWKHTHLIMVWSQLGGQPGLRDEGRATLPQSLGGRSVSTLETRSDVPLFPELWRSAEEAYWTLGTRHDPGTCPVTH
ncbi:tryptophan 2,3-dioxygenase [Allokutzneria albata]|uniref:Tryptophan 2,3-dioxygenase (Vermilion) n=1 Tax=Allokutzneria albata TaxID=211114 RepID=A0A1G9TZW5_ALLAB|nr:hypothetical protein [Allokutzneria albata]SDM53222.1 Tryptophan 2,3-dioxygenase (vermilion) [Allokutzneria albata]